MATERRITPWIVEEMVRALGVSKDTCILLHPGMLPKNRMPRVRTGDGRRMYLHRYLYWRATGEELDPAIALIRDCKSSTCLNPFHFRQSRRRSLQRVVCPNGHRYPKQDRVELKWGYRCLVCYEERLRRNRKGKHGKGKCRKGHWLTGENVYWYTRQRDGKRIRKCRRCAKEVQQQYRDRKAMQHG